MCVYFQPVSNLDYAINLSFAGLLCERRKNSEKLHCKTATTKTSSAHTYKRSVAGIYNIASALIAHKNWRKNEKRKEKNEKKNK